MQGLNIIRGLGQEEGVLFFVYDYHEYGSLADLVREEKI